MLLDNEGDGHVFGRGQSGKEVIVLEDKTDGVQAEIGDVVGAEIPDFLALDHDGPGIRPQDPGNHAQEGGFPAAGGTDDVEHFSETGL